MDEILRVIGHLLLIPVFLVLEFICLVIRFLIVGASIIFGIGTIGCLFFAIAFALVGYGAAAQRWQLVLISFGCFLVPTFGYFLLYFVQGVQYALSERFL